MYLFIFRFRMSVRVLEWWFGFFLLCFVHFFLLFICCLLLCRIQVLFIVLKEILELFLALLFASVLGTNIYPPLFVALTSYAASHKSGGFCSKGLSVRFFFCAVRYDLPSLLGCVVLNFTLFSIELEKMVCFLRLVFFCSYVALLVYLLLGLFVFFLLFMLH